MRITSIEYWKENMELTRPYAVTYVLHDSIENIFIKLNTANGTYGLGAGSPSEHVTGELIDDQPSDLIPELESLLVGKDLSEYQPLIAKLSLKYAARPALLAALDMALHDALCKHLDISLGKFLGVQHKPLPTSITIGLKNVAETVEEGLEYKGRNFQIIKLKIGQSYEEDIERSIKLREAVGKDMLIRVDANQGYDQHTFTEYIKATKQANLEFFEQPMKPSMNDKMLALSEDIKELCAADESLHKQKSALELVKMGRPFGIFNIKIMKCGGITEARKISDVANHENISLMWGCMDESIISITASMHAALSCPTTKYLDLDGSLDLAKDVVKGGFKLENGILYPLYGRPGLGVELL